MAALEEIQRIIVRNLPYVATLEDVEQIITAAAVDKARPASAYTCTKMLATLWFHPGEAPCRHKTRGPVPGWFAVSIPKSEKGLMERIASSFDGKPFFSKQQHQQDPAKAHLIDEFSFQLASVEFGTLQALPASAFAAAATAATTTSSSDKSSSQQPNKNKKPVEGTIFDDAHFLAFKANLEKEADEPIPCNQDNAFDFLNKWLEKEGERENEAMSQSRYQTVRLSSGRRVRREMTFLERVRFRYEEEKKEQAAIESGSRKAKRSKEEKSSRRREKEAKRARKERERRDKEERREREDRKRLAALAVPKPKSNEIVVGSPSSNLNSFTVTTTAKSATLPVPTSMAATSSNVTLLKKREEIAAVSSSSSKDKKEKREKKEKSSSSSSSSRQSAAEQQRANVLASFANNDNDSDDDDTSVKPTSPPKNSFTVTKTTATSRHSDPSSPSSSAPGKQLLMRPAPRSSGI